MSARLNPKGPPQQVLVRMSAEMHEAVKRLAAEQDRSMAQEIRRAVRLHLERERLERQG